METLNLCLPKSWQELTDKQLQEVYTLLARNYTAAELKARCLFSWSGLSVVYRNEDFVKVQFEGREHSLTALQIAEVLPCLDWLDGLPPFPRHLAVIGRHHAINVLFQNVPFEKFIVADNFYQGYLHTQNRDLLLKLASVLYDTEKPLPLKAWEEVSVFYWFASLKDFFARRFPDFFKPANPEASNLLGSNRSASAQIQEAVDTMIRALTKGDITKEQEILQLNTWRALTELNAQAKEYEEIKALSHK